MPGFPKGVELPPIALVTVTPSLLPTDRAEESSLTLPLSGVGSLGVLEMDDGVRELLQVTMVPVLLLLAGVAKGDEVAMGRLEELRDPLEEIERCCWRVPVGEALLQELDQGLPATISRGRGDGVPLSAKKKKLKMGGENLI